LPLPALRAVPPESHDETLEPISLPPYASRFIL
jgi:hypothetical protein